MVSHHRVVLNKVAPVPDGALQATVGHRENKCRKTSYKRPLSHAPRGRIQVVEMEEVEEERAREMAVATEETVAAEWGKGRRRGSRGGQ